MEFQKTQQFYIVMTYQCVYSINGAWFIALDLI